MRIFICYILALCFFSLSGWLQAEAAAKGPMFSKGVEVFKVQNEKGKTPEFRVLDDDATDKALAFAVIAFINSHQEVNPKVPVRDYVDLKVESLKLAPAGKVELDVFLKLSGYELELDRRINRKKFLSGETIDLIYAPRTKNVAMFSVHSSGSLRMKFNAKSNTLLLQKVHAKMNYESQFGGSGHEELRFSGKGIRQ